MDSSPLTVYIDNIVRYGIIKVGRVLFLFFGNLTNHIWCDIIPSL